MAKHGESLMQQGCVRWFDYQYPKKRMNLFSIPNEGKRTPENGARMTAMGRRKGVADMFLAIAGWHKTEEGLTAVHGVFFEFKSDNGSQAKEQKDFQKAVEEAGYLYVIIKTGEEFQKFIENYLGKVPPAYPWVKN